MQVLYQGFPHISIFFGYFCCIHFTNFGLYDILIMRWGSVMYRSELVIALSCAVGTDILPVRKVIEDELNKYGYRSHIIKISKTLLEPLSKDIAAVSNFERAMTLMDLGNEMRTCSEDGAILAKGAIHQITQYRRQTNSGKENKNEPVQGTAYIIDSLKHPDEVKLLRDVYTSGFYLFAINESELSRRENLNNSKNIGKNDAQELIDRDLEEKEKYGQKTRRVFELADFHLSLNGWKKTFDPSQTHRLNSEKISKRKREIVQGQISRIIKLMFSNPFITPTFDEYAMFMAYSAGLRSADLSRQIGAVIATPNQEIVAMGANDCPRFGGGQYWPEYNSQKYSFSDVEDGRDYMRGFDSNKQEHFRIVEEIVNLFDFPDTDYGEKSKQTVRDRIYNSRIKLLTEYGRPVHAEMAAILSCARTGISLQNATLYCSTFPCHNCAKHIIGAGIKRVVYIEPYPKSKSVELYSDSLILAEALSDNSPLDRVCFEEFVGIGPRRFFDLFSLSLSTGASLSRKNSKSLTGEKTSWKESSAELRCPMAPTTYFERENYGTLEYLSYLKAIKEKK